MPYRQLAGRRDAILTDIGFRCSIRYYDPALGRYISRDPAGYVDGLNVYVYVSNNPVGRIDARGLDDEALLRAKARDATAAVQQTARGLFGNGSSECPTCHGARSPRWAGNGFQSQLLMTQLKAESAASQRLGDMRDAKAIFNASVGAGGFDILLLPAHASYLFDRATGAQSGPSAPATLDWLDDDNPSHQTSMSAMRDGNAAGNELIIDVVAAAAGLGVGKVIGKLDDAGSALKRLDDVGDGLRAGPKGGPALKKGVDPERIRAIEDAVRRGDTAMPIDTMKQSQAVAESMGENVRRQIKRGDLGRAKHVEEASKKAVDSLDRFKGLTAEARASLKRTIEGPLER